MKITVTKRTIQNYKKIIREERSLNAATHAMMDIRISEIAKLTESNERQAKVIADNLEDLKHHRATIDLLQKMVSTATKRIMHLEKCLGHLVKAEGILEE